MGGEISSLTRVWQSPNGWATLGPEANNRMKSTYTAALRRDMKGSTLFLTLGPCTAYKFKLIGVDQKYQGLIFQRSTGTEYLLAKPVKDLAMSPEFFYVEEGYKVQVDLPDGGGRFANVYEGNAKLMDVLADIDIQLRPANFTNVELSNTRFVDGKNTTLSRSMRVDTCAAKHSAMGRGKKGSKTSKPKSDNPKTSMGMGKGGSKVKNVILKKPCKA